MYMEGLSPRLPPAYGRGRARGGAPAGARRTAAHRSPGTIEEGSVTGDVTVNDKSELLTLTPSASGEYTFDCHSSARALALGDAASVSGIVTGAGAFLGSLFLGGAGTIVLIIGIVWAVKRRSSNRKAQAFLDSQAPGGMTA